MRILELQPDEARLLRASVGWWHSLVGKATIPLDHSQAGYLLRHNEPIIEYFRTDTRFQINWLLREHHGVSGIRAVIRGEQRHYGELAAHTRGRRGVSGRRPRRSAGQRPPRPAEPGANGSEPPHKGVALNALDQDAPEITLTRDQHPVQAPPDVQKAIHRSQAAFGSWCSEGSGGHPDTIRMTMTV